MKSKHKCKPHEIIKWLMISSKMECGCSPFLQHNTRLEVLFFWKWGEGSPFIGDERWNGRLRSNVRWRARIPQDQWGGGQVSSTWIRVLDQSKGEICPHMYEQPLMVTWSRGGGGVRSMPSHTCVSQLDSHVKGTSMKEACKAWGVMGSMNMPHTCVSTHLGLEGG